MIVDKVIEIISPQMALDREIKRKRLEMLRSVNINNSGYDSSAASRSKSSMKGWGANSKSPQEDIDKNSSVMRQRSRDLYMSAPLAVSAIKTSRTNIVGTGLRLRPTCDYEVLGWTYEEAQKWNKNTLREFNLWAESKFCDATRQNNFYEMQQLVELSYLMNGDAAGIIQYEESNMVPAMPYDLRINLLEADRICNPNTYGEYVDINYIHTNGNRVFNGVEINKNGAVEAYHICNTYPSSMQTVQKEWKRVEAFNKVSGLPNVLMIYESERIGQYRGVPFLAPVIEAIKQLTRYQEAEIMAAVINGFFTVFITTEKDPSDMLYNGFGDDTDGVDEEENEYGLGPGMINILSPGEDVKMADPSRPTANFDSFTSAFTKYIGAALEIPYELLVKSFTSSYSASRAALEEAWKVFKMKRKWLVDDFCQPIYEIFLYEAIAKGRINAVGFFENPTIRKAYCKAEWNGPAKAILDPVKEVNASEKRINIGISTREIETIEQMGGEFDNNIQQLIRENELMQKATCIEKKE